MVVATAPRLLHATARHTRRFRRSAGRSSHSSAPPAPPLPPNVQYGVQTLLVRCLPRPTFATSPKSTRVTRPRR